MPVLQRYFLAIEVSAQNSNAVKAGRLNPTHKRGKDPQPRMGIPSPFPIRISSSMACFLS